MLTTCTSTNLLLLQETSSTLIYIMLFIYLQNTNLCLHANLLSHNSARNDLSKWSLLKQLSQVIPLNCLGLKAVPKVKSCHNSPC